MALYEAKTVLEWSIICLVPYGVLRIFDSFIKFYHWILFHCRSFVNFYFIGDIEWDRYADTHGRYNSGSHWNIPVMKRCSVKFNRRIIIQKNISVQSLIGFGCWSCSLDSLMRILDRCRPLMALTNAEATSVNRSTGRFSVSTMWEDCDLVRWHLIRKQADYL